MKGDLYFLEIGAASPGSTGTTTASGRHRLPWRTDRAGTAACVLAARSGAINLDELGRILPVFGLCVQLIPEVAVEDAAGITGGDVPRVGIRTGTAAAALTAVSADRAMIGAPAAIGENGKKLAVPDFRKGLLTQTANLDAGDIYARCDGSVGLDRTVAPTCHAPRRGRIAQRCVP